MNARRCFGLTLAVLVAATLARGFGVAGPDVVWVPVTTAALAVVARGTGASAGDLGLRWSDAGRGARYGAAASALVLAVLVVGALLPATRGALHDARGAVPLGQLVRELLVTVVLLTAIPEEFAFRGVLLGAGVALWGPVRGALAVSALFGLWHVVPTLATMSGNPATSGLAASPAGRAAVVLGAVAATFAAGVAFAWLRLRSRSLVAPVLAHAATNGLGLAVAWVVVRT